MISIIGVVVGFCLFIEKDCGSRSEWAAKEIKRLSCGMKAVDVNTDAILVYSYILNQNVTDVLDMDV